MKCILSLIAGAVLFMLFFIGVAFLIGLLNPNDSDDGLERPAHFNYPIEGEERQDSLLESLMLFDILDDGDLDFPFFDDDN